MRGAGVPDICRSSFACSCAIPVRVAASLKRSWVCRARRRRCVGEVGLALAAFGFELAALGLDVDLGPVLPEQLADGGGAAPQGADRGASEAVRERRGFGPVAASQLDALTGAPRQRRGRYRSPSPPPSPRWVRPTHRPSSAYAIVKAIAEGNGSDVTDVVESFRPTGSLPGAGADAAGPAPRSVRAGWMDRALSGASAYPGRAAA